MSKHGWRSAEMLCSGFTLNHLETKPSSPSVHSPQNKLCVGHPTILGSVAASADGWTIAANHTDPLRTGNPADGARVHGIACRKVLLRTPSPHYPLAHCLQNDFGCIFFCRLPRILRPLESPPTKPPLVKTRAMAALIQPYDACTTELNSQTRLALPLIVVCFPATCLFDSLAILPARPRLAPDVPNTLIDATRLEHIHPELFARDGSPSSEEKAERCLFQWGWNSSGQPLALGPRAAMTKHARSYPSPYCLHGHPWPVATPTPCSVWAMVGSIRFCPGAVCHYTDLPMAPGITRS
jgi:hypothetical protein